MSLPSPCRIKYTVTGEVPCLKLFDNGYKNTPCLRQGAFVIERLFFQDFRVGIAPDGIQFQQHGTHAFFYFFLSDAFGTLPAV